MEKNRNKIREPYKPEDTPNPPQIIDPVEGGQKKKPVKEKDVNQQGTRSDGNNKKPHLLGDETEIDDETTI